MIDTYGDIRKPPLMTDRQLAKLLAPFANPKAVSETKVFQPTVVALAKAYGWKVNAVSRAKVSKGRAQWVTNTTLKGWPDLTLIKPPRIVFLELKGWDGKPSPEQTALIADLQQCGDNVEAYIVCPSELRDIIDILAALD